MKRILILALALLLMMNCACAENLPYEKYDALIRCLENGDYEQAFLEVARIAESAKSSGGALVPECTGTDWLFHMDLINTTGTPLALTEVRITDTLNGQLRCDPFVFTGKDLAGIGLGDTLLMPDNGFRWSDGHPVVSDFDHREYAFIFRSAGGDEHVLTFPFDLSGTPIPQQNPQAVNDWHFEIILSNTGDIPLRLVSLSVTDFLNGQQTNEPHVFDEAGLNNIGLGGIHLNPGDILPWSDGHPVVDFFNGREYRFTFADDNGNLTDQSFMFELSPHGQELVGGSLPDYSQDTGRDLLTLRHDAAYEVPVHPGIFWVPARTLGESRYTNADIHAMRSLSPEEKQSQISTLYEALQLYQIGNFASADDNIRISENGVNWEHHKPGFDAVRTNEGCCATDSNWLNYILRGDYEEVGYIATSQRDGSGHIFNYLLHEGWYYIIDLTHYRTDWIATAVENGNPDSYSHSDIILGNIHRTQDIQCFVDYMQSVTPDAPGLMFMYTAENCLAVDGAPEQNGVTIIYEERPDVPVNIIFDDPGDSLFFRFAPPPQQLPDWTALPDFDFSAAP